MKTISDYITALSELYEVSGIDIGGVMIPEAIRYEYVYNHKRDFTKDVEAIEKEINRIKEGQLYE
jgi:hypothetical protein